MKGSTNFATATPTPVAIAYPNMPVSSAGSTSDRQFLFAAMPAAVVGPPTLAFEANTSSRRGKFIDLPTPTVTRKCTMICMEVWRNRAGAIRITVGMWPMAPVTEKKNY